MTYSLKWELLASTLLRLIEVGCPEWQAKEQICAAMVDGVVSARIKWGSAPPAPWSVPGDLRPEHLDWAASCRVERETVPPFLAVVALVRLPPAQAVAWLSGAPIIIELCRDHVDSVLLASSSANIANGSSLDRTGAAGRPTSMHLIEREMRSRAANGHLALTLSEETEILSQWLSDAHPDMPPVKPKSMGNSLRGIYNDLKSKSLKL
jgi:hypothetical protein